MPGLPVRLRTADRTALVALCLLLVASVSARIYAYRTAPPASGPSPETGVVALGEGVFVPRGDVGQRLVWTASCPTSVTVDFVEPSPHGRDTSLAAPPNPSDRTYYVYRGWTLDGPRAAMKLSILFFVQRAGAVLRVSGAMARDELAVKLVVPAACDASPDVVMAALRRDVRSAF